MKSALTRRRFLGATAATSAAGLVARPPAAGAHAPARPSPRHPIPPGEAPPPAAGAQAPARPSPRHPILPVESHQPKDTRLTLLGTSGGPPPDYVRTGASTALTVGGHNYVIDAGRSSVTQYLNAGLLFAN